jgi:hypothetical protein
MSYYTVSITSLLDFDTLLLRRLYFLSIFSINAKLEINMLVAESSLEMGLEL